MNRLLKWIAVAAAAAVVLVLALAVMLYITVDEQQIKQRIVEATEAELNAKLGIDGELTLNLLPTLQLAANDVRLTGPGDSGEEIAAAQVLRFGAELWPLLRGRLSVSELTIEGLRLHLHRGADGHGNWESLARTSTTAGASSAHTPAIPDAAPSAPDSPVSAASTLDLAIERVRIEDGAIDFRDERAGKRYQLQFLTLRGDGFDLQGAPFRLESEGRLVIDEGAQELQLALNADVRADQRARTLSLADATLRLVRSAAPALEFRLPAVDMAFDRKHLEARDIAVAADGLDGSASLALDWAEPAKASGTLHLARLDLPALAPALGITLPPALNPAALEAIALDASIAQTGDTIRLGDLKLRAGELSAEGELSYASTTPPRLDARLAIPTLDLDYLLPPPTVPPGDEEEEDAAAAAASPPGTTAAPSLADQLKYAGKIEASIGTLKRRGVEMSDVKASLALQPGTAQLERLGAGLYGGTLNASGRLDARGAGKLAVDAKLAAVDLRALLAASAQEERMTGQLDGTLAFTATGTSSERWVASLAGPLSIEVRDPVIREVSVEKSVCTAVATLNKEALSAQFPADTKLDKLGATLDFENGVGKLRTLSATLPDMALKGKGTVDLPGRKFAIQLDARVTEDLETLDPACRMTRKMQAVEWPVSCKGKFGEPPKKWCGVDDDDLAKIATQLAGQKLKDKLKEKIGDFLRSH